MEILQSVIAAVVDEITANIGWGCVKGEVATVAIEKWANLERGKRTAHPDTLTPEDGLRGAIRPGDPDTWLELRRPWRPCCQIYSPPTHSRTVQFDSLMQHHISEDLKFPFALLLKKEAIYALQYNRLVNYFAEKDWLFHDTNVRFLLEQLTPEDRNIFYFDIKQLIWESYLEICVKGVRQYILKDDPSTLPKARKRYKM